MEDSSHSLIYSAESTAKVEGGEGGTTAVVRASTMVRLSLGNSWSRIFETIVNLIDPLPSCFNPSLAKAGALPRCGPFVAGGGVAGCPYPWSTLLCSRRICILYTSRMLEASGGTAVVVLVSYSRSLITQAVCGIRFTAERTALQSKNSTLVDTVVPTLKTLFLSQLPASRTQKYQKHGAPQM